MVFVMLVGHGKLPQGMLDAAELILGKQEAVGVFGLEAGEAPEVFAEALKDVLTKSTSDGVLVLADMLGGSPANSIASVLRTSSKVRLVTGLNLPMLLEVLLARPSRSVDELAELAVRCGKEGIHDLFALISGSSANTEDRQPR